VGTLRLRPVTVIWLVAVLVVVAGFIAVVWFGQRHLIYFPDTTSPRPPADAREVTLETSDGLRLAAWRVSPSAPDRGLAVLLAPGNGGNRAGRMVLAREMASVGLTVLLIDYRGYGGNPGRPDEEGLARDVRAGLAYLSAAGFGPDRIIYFGESLGSGVVAELATEFAPAGLVLRSPFVDLASVGAHHYPLLPVRALLRDRYPVADNVETVTAPTVVIYGSADTIVPADQSRHVAERAAGTVSVIVVDGADHNDAELAHGPNIIGPLVDLVNRISRQS
jgi:pimeloyl-ACP methyl ester carboxylesterase